MRSAGGEIRDRCAASKRCEDVRQGIRQLMLSVAGKRILQTLREKKSNRKLIGIGYLFGLTHHNIFGLSNGQCQLLGQAEKRLLSLLFQYYIKFDNSFSDAIEIQ